MSKSRDAFRTISEVADVLDTPAHVLRFWESKFSQVKPVKRAGGRRYYRPADVDLLAGIKQLLHDDGMTIKGAQKLIREQGVKQVSATGAAALDATVTGMPDDKNTVQPNDLNMPSPDADIPTQTAGNTPELQLGITNVVNLPKKQDGPTLTLNLAPTQTGTDDPVSPQQQIASPVSEPAPDLLNDPADGDSKAPARLFHLLKDLSGADLAKQAESIAPLLDRMRNLRGRIQTG